MLEVDIVNAQAPKFTEHSALRALGLAQGQSAKIHAQRSRFAPSQVQQRIDSARANRDNKAKFDVTRLFEAMVISLGTVPFLKRENVGSVFLAHAKASVPDYRLGLMDGRQLLIKVQLCSHEEPITRPFHLSLEDIEQWETYATGAGAVCKLAIYWSHSNLWALVDRSGPQT